MKRVSILLFKLSVFGFLYAQSTSNENVTYDPHDFFTQGFIHRQVMRTGRPMDHRDPCIGKTMPVISYNAALSEKDYNHYR